MRSVEEEKRTVQSTLPSRSVKHGTKKASRKRVGKWSTVVAVIITISSFGWIVYDVEQIKKNEQSENVEMEMKNAQIEKEQAEKEKVEKIPVFKEVFTYNIVGVKKYKVKEKDTLQSIAKKYYKDTEKKIWIIQYNSLSNEKVKKGMILSIPIVKIPPTKTLEEVINN